MELSSITEVLLLLTGVFDVTQVSDYTFDTLPCTEHPSRLITNLLT